MFELVPVVGEVMKDFYPEVLEKKDFIAKVVKNEEERFHETLHDGEAILAEVIAKANVPCCLMHNRKEAVYHNYMQDVLADLEESLEMAKQAGIVREKILLDPGIGFAKTYEQNLLLLQQLEVLNSFGYPVLLGTSRKSVIGLTLNVPASERVSGTLATTVMGVMKGCSFVRVHDIRENVEAIKMTEAILQVEE